MTHRPYLTALLLLALGACEDEGDSGDETCTYAGSLSGDIASALPGSGVSCVTQFSGGDGIDVEYVTVSDPTVRVDLVIDAVTKGMTGDGFPTEVRVLNDDLDIWASLACTVDISEHSLIGPAELGNESWQVRGVGRCDAALARDGGGTITLTPFEFATTVTWTD